MTIHHIGVGAFTVAMRIETHVKLKQLLGEFSDSSYVEQRLKDAMQNALINEINRLDAMEPTERHALKTRYDMDRMT